MKIGSSNGDSGLSAPGGETWDATAKPRRKQPAVNETLQLAIGSQLKAAYDEVVKERVPDRFLELLSDLEARQGS